MAPALDSLTAIAFVALFAAVVALSLRRPIAGPLALLGTLPFDAPHALGWTTLGSPKVVLLGAAVAGIVRRLDASVLRRPPVLGLVLAAAAVLGATALSAANAGDRLEVVRQVLKAAEYLAALVVAAVMFASDPDERAVRSTVAGAALLVSALACFALATGRVGSVAPVDGMLLPRIAGPIEGPNQLAGYLGLLLPVALAFALRADGSALERIAVAAGAGALVLTLSRAGIAAGLVALLLVFALEPRIRPQPFRARKVRLVALLAIVAGGVAAFCALAASLGDAGFLAGARLVIARLTMGEPLSTGGVGHRGDLWRAALELWRGHPLFGIGAGNFELDLGQAGLRGVRTHANSLYLQALVEGGIPLSAATLAWVYASTVPLLRRVAPGSTLLLGVAAGSLALALHQLVDLLAFYPKVGETTCVLLGMAAALAARPRTRADTRPEPASAA